MQLHNRQIKAGFWNDPDLLRLPRDARTLFHGLIHLAEDSGCLPYDAFGFKMLLFPSPLDADMTEDRIRELTELLIASGLIIRYYPPNKRNKPCLYVVNFHKHQVLKNPSAPDTPLPPWIIWETYESNPSAGKYVLIGNPDEWLEEDNSPKTALTENSLDQLRLVDPSSSSSYSSSTSTSKSNGEHGEQKTRDKADPAKEFFDHWCEVWADTYKRRPRLTDARRTKIRNRLKTFSLDELKEACDNLHASDWHRGKNERGWVADIDFLIRSDEQVDKWANNPPVKLPKVRGDPQYAESVPDLSYLERADALARKAEEHEIQRSQRQAQIRATG